MDISPKKLFFRPKMLKILTNYQFCKTSPFRHNSKKTDRPSKPVCLNYKTLYACLNSFSYFSLNLSYSLLIRWITSLSPATLSGWNILIKSL